MSPCPAQPNIELGSPDNSGPSCEPQVSWCHLNHGQNHPATHLDHRSKSGVPSPAELCIEPKCPSDTWTRCGAQVSQFPPGPCVESLGFPMTPGSFTPSTASLWPVTSQPV